MRGREAFVLNQMCLRDEGFKDVVREAWSKNNLNSTKLSERLITCGEVIKEWNERKLGKVHKRIKSLKEHIENLEKEERAGEVIA